METRRTMAEPKFFISFNFLASLINGNQLLNILLGEVVSF